MNEVRRKALNELKEIAGNWLLGTHRHFIGQPKLYAVGVVTAKKLVYRGPQVWAIVVQWFEEPGSVEHTLEIIQAPPWGNLIGEGAKLPIWYQEAKNNHQNIVGGIDFDRLELKVSS